MKFKNINPVERYFDKATILIALAAAGYFVYSGYVQEPNAIKRDADPHSWVLPGQIETKIAQANATLQDQIKNQKPINVNPPDYVVQYKETQRQPLPPGLLAGVPTMAPSQLAINLANEVGPTTQPAIALPVVPVLTEPEITQARALIVWPPVANAPAPGPAPGAAPLVAPPKDIVYVQGTALIQVATLVQNIDAIKRVELRHTAIYRIEVQRQEQRGGGPWSPWVDVPRLSIDPLPPFDPAKVDPKDWAEAVANERAQVQKVVNPDNYKLAVPQAAPPGPGPVPPHPNRGAPLHAPASAAPGMAPIPSGPSGNFAVPSGPSDNFVVPSGPNASFPPPGNIPPPAGGVAPGAPDAVASTVPAVAAPDAQALLNLDGTTETLPVHFYDDQVQPEYTYRYRVRLVIVNPLYHLPKQIDTNPKEGRDQAFLASDWTQFKPVTIEADEYFYLTANNLGEATAYFKIYKWRLGTWVAADDQAEPGLTLGGKHPVVLVHGQPATEVDFGSVYTIVDVRPVLGTGSADIQVVLLNNSTGELVVHDLLSDTQDPQRKKLEDAIAPPRQVTNNVGP